MNTQTADRQQQRNVEPAGSALVAFERARLPITADFGKKLDITAGQWRVLVDQIFPTAQSVDSVMMALSYCKTRNLDIFKKPVHIVPMWSTALKRMVETVWPGIAEIRTTAARTGEYAGIDEIQFGPMKKRAFTSTDAKTGEVETIELEFPEWASVVVYRFVKGDRCAFHTKVFWEETYATLGKTELPNTMWRKRPRGQIDKCVEAAGLRRAFPEELGSTYAAEEMEGRTIEHDAGEVAFVQPKQPPRPTETKPAEPAKETTKPASTELQGKQVEDAHVDDAGFGEITETTTQEPAPEQEREEVTPGEMLEAFDTEAQTAKTELEVQEIWNKHDLLARLQSAPKGEEFVGVVRGVKEGHLRRVRKG